MRYLLNASGIAAAITFAAFASSAVAQENTITLTCQNIGSRSRPRRRRSRGHSTGFTQFSCRVNSGPMSGGVLTGAAIWEWDKTNGVLVSGSGVARKPGATLVEVYTKGKIALTMLTAKSPDSPPRDEAATRWRSAALHRLPASHSPSRQSPLAQANFRLKTRRIARPERSSPWSGA